MQPERVRRCVARKQNDSEQQSSLSGRMKGSDSSGGRLQIQHGFTLENVLATSHLRPVAESGGHRMGYVSSHDKAKLFALCSL